MDTMGTILYYENMIRNSKKKGLEVMSTGLWMDYAHMCKKAGKEFEEESDYRMALRHYYRAADIYIQLIMEKRKYDKKTTWLLAREAVPVLEKSSELSAKMPGMQDIYHGIQNILSFIRTQVVLLNPESKPDEQKDALLQMIDATSKLG